MSPYRRNTLVGASVIFALAILGWMILQFGEAPATLLTRATIPIHFESDRADGLGDGSVITYRGVAVGHITSVKLTDDKLHVSIDGSVYTNPPLPANIQGVIRSQGLIGGAAMMVLTTTSDQPQGTLTKNATLPAHFVGLEVLPPEFAQLAGELRVVVQQFQDHKFIDQIDKQLKTVGHILESVDKVVSDPKIRDDVKVAMDNMRSASESASRIGKQLEHATTQVSETLTDVRTTVQNTNKNVDSLARQFGDRLTQIAKTLDHLESITAKIDSGQGTAGQLVNDPKLYQSLVDTARELNATVADFKRLAEQWEQEGVSLKVK